MQRERIPGASHPTPTSACREKVGQRCRAGGGGPQGLALPAPGSSWILGPFPLWDQSKMRPGVHPQVCISGWRRGPQTDICDLPGSEQSLSRSKYNQGRAVRGLVGRPGAAAAAASALRPWDARPVPEDVVASPAPRGRAPETLSGVERGRTADGARVGDARTGAFMATPARANRGL